VNYSIKDIGLKVIAIVELFKGEIVEEEFRVAPAIVTG
jgi:hypothetical protein